MAFWGCKFSFDGVSCDDHQLMLYSIGKNEPEETEFAHVVKIKEERVGGHWKPLFFGVTYENKLETEIVFGVNQDRLDDHTFLTREEMANISSWLAGHDQYKWFEVEQDDLADVRYRCMVTSLSMVEYGAIPWAFKATLTCDGPYAYRHPQEYHYEVNGDLTISFDNQSDHNGYYCPVVKIQTGTSILTEESDNVLTNEDDSVLLDGGEFVIENETTGKRTVFSGLPDTVNEIILDNEHGTISSNTNDNMYRYFNFNFLKLTRGMNTLKFTGSGTVTIYCEFPVSVGM